MTPSYVSQIKKRLITDGWISEVEDGCFMPLKGFEKFRQSQQSVENLNLDIVNNSLDNLHSSLDIVNKSLDNLNHNNNRLSNRVINRDLNKEKRDSSRGTRIGDDFTISGEMLDWASANFPSVDVYAETQAFVDYFKSVSGAKGVKLDWVATWRNWIRRSSSFKNKGTAKKSTADTMADYHKWFDSIGGE